MQTIQEQLIQIDDMIEKDVTSAKEKLLELTQTINVETYDLELEFLTNKIHEKELFLAFTNEQKKQYYSLQEQGSNYYRDHHFFYAMNCYEAAKYQTNHPIFDYYLGKINYVVMNFEQAIFYLENYASHGGEKMQKCLLYLGQSYRKVKKNQEAKEVFQKMQRLNNMFQINFPFYLRKRKKEEDPIELRPVEEPLPKISNSKEEPTLTFSIILKRFEEGQILTAEKLLKNYKPQENEKKEYEQFLRNKRLYKMKRKK